MQFLIRQVRAHGRALVFAVLAGFALWNGAGAAWDGLPRLVAALTPGMAAEARGRPPEVAWTEARLALPGFAQSRAAPQLLYPVVAHAFPAWLQSPPRAAAPVIAICIDDLGEDLSGTSAAIRLPAAVTLSFLPFPDTTPAFAAQARAAGHMVIAHIPMQAVSAIDPGPMALMVGMDRDEILRRLLWDLGRVPGASGINNHEGSRFTADAAALAPVMTVLKARGLFFLDSRTGPASVGEAAARAAGVESGARDIFLDDDQSATSVRHQLDLLVATAKRQGAAIAIGHPHAATLAVLKQWLAEDHGVRLVPVEQAMRAKANLVAAR